MKKILLIAALVLTASLAVDAQRHDPRYDSGRYEVRARPERVINELQRDIKQQLQMGARRNLLSPREAKRFLKEYDKIAAKEKRYARRSRMTPRESREIIRELENLQHRVRLETREHSRKHRSNWARY